MELTRWASALVVAVCALLLLRLLLPAPHRARFDLRARLMGQQMARGLKRLRQRWQGLRHGRRHRADAERLTRDAIERARQGPRVKREGNVIKPDAFKGPRKPH